MSKTVLLENHLKITPFLNEEFFHGCSFLCTSSVDYSIYLGAIQQIFIEHLLCVQALLSISKQNRQKSLPSS